MHEPTCTRGLEKKGGLFHLVLRHNFCGNSRKTLSSILALYHFYLMSSSGTTAATTTTATSAVAAAAAGSGNCTGSADGKNEALAKAFIWLIFLDNFPPLIYFPLI